MDEWIFIEIRWSRLAYVLILWCFVQIMRTPVQIMGNFWALIERDGDRTIGYNHTWNHLLLGKEPPCWCAGLGTDEQLILDATFLRQLLFVRFAIFGQIFFPVTGVCFGRHTEVLRDMVRQSEGDVGVFDGV